MKAKAVATWKLKENPNYEPAKIGSIGDDDSWLEEQSLCTDTDIKEAIDVQIDDESFLRKLVQETSKTKKRSKAMFLGHSPKQNKKAK